MFEGQQSDERILTEIRSYALSKYIAIAKIIALSIFFYLVLSTISNITTLPILKTAGLFFSLILLTTGIWWNNLVYAKDRTYITDRRIIRFDQVSPFFQTKRELFWSEALKAKGYAPNILFRMMKVGTLEIDPIMGEKENVVIKDVYYFEDLANYIDKILYTFKNKPVEISTITPFVPKPKGQRG